MKKTKFKLLNILLTLALAITMMPAFTQMVYAGTDVYTNLIPTGDEDAEALAAKQVTFNNKSWYIIEDNSTSATAGSVTLLVADTSFGTSTFGSNNTYVGSTVKGTLDALTQSGGAFADVADAIINKIDNENDIGKLYLLNGSEAGQVSENVRKLKFESTFDDHGKWWLRSPGSMPNVVSAVWGDTGGVAYDGGGVSTTQGVRPALQLDLSKVTFNSSANTFSLGSSYTVSFDMGGHYTPVPENQTIANGDLATAPIKPVNYDKASDYDTTGLRFRMWDEVAPADLTYSTLWDGGFNFSQTAITKNTVLHAIYESILSLKVYDLTNNKEASGGTITYTDIYNGTPQTTSGIQTTLIEGTSETLTANPAENYSFVGWSTSSSESDIISTENPYTFTNNGRKTVYALFEKESEAVASITNGSTVTNYTDINSAMSAWDTGTTLTLLKDVSITGTHSHRKTNTLDLNGHTFTTSGNFNILSGATLTINDSSSPNTGLFTKDRQRDESLIWVNNGHLVLNGGTLFGKQTQCPVVDFYEASNCSFTMNGGKITGSASEGAVRFRSNCSFTMTGGEISGLTTTNGLFTGSTTAPLTISGKVVIQNNKKGEKTENVNLASGKVITISGELDSAASIGITMANPPGVFTSGLSGKGNASNFTSDNSDYSVSLNSSNEAQLVKGIQATVTGYNGTYDGQAHGISVTVTDPSSGAVIKYGTSEGTYNLDNSPTITDVSDSSKTFYYKVTADGYADKTGSATVTISQAANAITVDIEGWTYGQTAKTPTSNATYGTATYTYKEQGSSTYSETVPTKAGKHTVKASVAGTTNYAGAEATKDFTIAKAAGTVSYEITEVKKVVTDPEFTNPLKKTGDGTVTYSSSNPTVAGVDSDGKVTINAATDSPITIKATVADGDNYSYANNTAEYTLTISKATPEINADLAASAITYGQSLSDSTFTDATATYNGNPVAGSFAWKEPSTKPAVADSNKTAYTVVFTPTDDDTYTSVEVAKTLTVNKANSSVTTAPVANTLTYTGKPQALITGGKAEGGTMKYRCNANEYSATIPAGLDAGPYTVYYIVEGDENHNSTDPQSVSVTIAQANPSTLVPEGYVINAEVLDTLGNLTLPEGLEWVNPDTVISAAGTYTYPVKAKDTKNYKGETNITVKASYASYSYVEGSSSCQWTKGTSGTLPFTFKRSINDEKTLDSFSKASIDGKDMIQGVQFTIEKGSLKIYLKDSMLNTLSVGTHVLKVTFKDGEATTTFRVIEKSSGGGSSSKDYNPPKTGIE